jgi:hypothetical protein
VESAAVVVDVTEVQILTDSTAQLTPAAVVVVVLTTAQRQQKAAQAVLES